MDEAGSDPRCPECGGPIGATATYCMHCSADLTAERGESDADADGFWDQRVTASDSRDPVADTGEGTTSDPPGRTPTDSRDVAAEDGPSGRVLDPDGFVDNTLTAVVGIVGGLVVGVVGTVVLLALTGSGWALLFGLVAWLGATAYLVRRRTVQGAVAKSGYAVALVLLLVPVIAISPFVTVEGGTADRGGLFVVLLLLVAVPAAIAAAIGKVAAGFVPDDASGSEG